MASAGFIKVEVVLDTAGVRAIAEALASTPLSLEELTERMAKAIHAAEYGRWNPDAVPDHNKWTWDGYETTETERDIFRTYARAAFDGLTTVAAVSGDLPTENDTATDEGAISVVAQAIYDEMAFPKLTRSEARTLAIAAMRSMASLGVLPEQPQPDQEQR